MEGFQFAIHKILIWTWQGGPKLFPLEYSPSSIPEMVFLSVSKFAIASVTCCVIKASIVVGFMGLGLGSCGPGFLLVRVTHNCKTNQVYDKFHNVIRSLMKYIYFHWFSMIKFTSWIYKKLHKRGVLNRKTFMLHIKDIAMYYHLLTFPSSNPKNLFSTSLARTIYHIPI